MNNLDQTHRMLSWKSVEEAVLFIEKTELSRASKVFGIPRGGTHIAQMLWALGYQRADLPGQADLIVDDLVDSGDTRNRYMTAYPDAKFWAPFIKDPGSPWIIFPWETQDGLADPRRVQGPTDAVTRLLQFIGEDPKRDGLLRTPDRVVRALGELTSGYKEHPGDILSTVFKESTDEMIVLRDLEFWSLCEHHMLPFHGTVSLGYIPNGEIVGLSKLARLVRCFSKRLQVQERMTEQVTEAMMSYLRPLGAGCVVKATHTCMAMRGVREAAEMVTSSLIGAMREPGPRAEFLKLSG